MNTIHPNRAGGMGTRRPVTPAAGLRAALAVVALAACPGVTQSILAGQATDSAGEAQQVQSEQTESAALPRAIVWIDRSQTVQGHVVNEDDTIISLREQDGVVTAYSKSRVMRIIRLVEPGEQGRNGTVYLRNGEHQTGLVLNDGFDAVTIEIAGVRATFKRDIVLEVILEPTIDEKYEHYKKTLDPAAHETHLELCQWLVDNGRLEPAKQELVELLAKAELPAARKLLRVVDAQLALRKPAPKRTDGDSLDADTVETAAEESESGPVTLRDLLPKEVVSEADVNIIRVYEIDFDRPPRVTVRPETIRKLIETYSTSKLIPTGQAERTALFRAEGLDLTRLMFELKARELYNEIEVTTEPYALNLFRQRVHNSWLMNNCATSRCHGGLEGGRFFLHRLNQKNPRVRYTNLLILERLVIDPDWPLINYDSPGDSLILQYGLPRSQARKPHPDVPNWTPVFTASDSRMLADAIEWIEAMMQPRPDYPVEYVPPDMKEYVPAGEAPDDPFAEAGGENEGGRVDR
jgi:hypothetical protein